MMMVGMVHVVGRLEMDELSGTIWWGAVRPITPVFFGELCCWRTKLPALPPISTARVDQTTLTKLQRDPFWPG